jgi:hypothetical protein
LVFINASEDSIMLNDVITPSNLVIMLVKKEKFKETLFNMNVPQQLCKNNRLEKWCTPKSMNMKSSIIS